MPLNSFSKAKGSSLYLITSKRGSFLLLISLLEKLVEVTIQESLPDMIIIITASIIEGIGLAIAITIILIRKRHKIE